MENQYFVKPEEGELMRFEGGRYSRLTLAPITSVAEGVAMGCHIMPPGTSNQMHIHETEQELFFVYSGCGKAIIGEREFRIEPETSFIASPGVAHRIINDGTEELRFVWVFSPPLESQKRKNQSDSDKRGGMKKNPK